MFTKLFHKDVFMPDNVDKAVASMQRRFDGYELSRHLQQHISNKHCDRSHDYLGLILESRLATIKNNPQEPFEVELGKDWYVFGDSNWHVTKYCIRLHYTNNQDIVVSIRPHFNKETKRYEWDKNLVVTAWLNHNNDNHTTLDDSKYCSKEEWHRIQLRR